MGGIISKERVGNSSVIGLFIWSSESAITVRSSVGHVVDFVGR